MWRRIKLKIAYYYTRYLMYHGASIKEIYNKTKKFYDTKPKWYWQRHDDGQYYYHYGNEVY